MTKSDYISKTKNCTKRKSYMQKMSARSIPIYPVNLATFEENWTFGRTKRPFWTPVVPKRDMMWYEVLRPYLFSAYCACIFYVKMATSAVEGPAYP